MPPNAIDSSMGLSYLRYGSSYTVTCREGYALKGDSVCTCLNNGMWNCSLVTCEGKKNMDDY